MINDIYWLIINIKRHKKFYLNSIVFFLFFSSVVIYLLSLKGCFLTFNECALHTKIKGYFKLGVLLIISCILFTLSFSIQIISNLGKINYLIFFTVYSVIFFSTQGTDFSHHGTYNSIIFVIFFPVFFLIFYIIYLTLYYIINLELKKILLSTFFFFYAIIFFYINTSCQNFYNGIGGEQLKNEKKFNYCFIKKPKICAYDLLSGIFDVSYYRRKGCNGFNDKKEIFLKYLDTHLIKYNNFSYPRTEYWEPELSYKNLADLVEKNIYPANVSNSKNNEVFVSFQEGKGRIQINLKKNFSLIEQKRELAKKYYVKFNNVYLIYLDAVSRNNFIRKLKRTTKLIEKLLYSNKKREKKFKNLNAFQFFKYHNFNGATQGNIYPLFFGNNLFSHKGISIVKFFNERGFVTAAAHNSCNKEIYDWENFDKNITFDTYDHENVALFCDTNYEDKIEKWSIRKGKSTVLRRCFYGRDSFDYNFEYILQFLEAYKTERKFFRVSFGDGHEATTEVIKYIDYSLSLFIQKILDNYFDDKTSIILLSDHGAHIPGPYDILVYEEKIIENYLGLFIFIIPDNNNNDQNIFYNQQMMITTYDIHDTLLDMINVNKYKYNEMNSLMGQSIFLKINGTMRNCQKYKEYITDEFCVCINY